MSGKTPVSRSPLSPLGGRAVNAGTPRLAATPRSVPRTPASPSLAFRVQRNQLFEDTPATPRRSDEQVRTGWQ